MERLVSLGAMLAFVSFCHTSAQHSVGTVVIDDGRVGIGLISGGNFGPGSFSIGGSADGRPHTSVYVNEDGKDDQHTIIQTHHKGQQENYQPPQSGGGNSGSTQLYPVKPLTRHSNPGQGGNGGEGGSEGGQILIGAVVLNKNNHNKENKNGNKQPELDAATLEAIFGSNSGNNDLPSAKNSLSNTGERGSIQIGSITGGKFEEGTYNINNNNNKSATNVLQKGSAVNNGNTGNSNAGNEAQYYKGHGANNNGLGKAGVGSNHGQTNSDYNWGSSEEPWIWER